MVETEVVIDEMRCYGCGLCEMSCPRDCIKIRGDKITPLGYSIPTFIKSGSCNACGFCAWMCPHTALEIHVRVGS